MVHESDLLHFINDKWLVEMNYNIFSSGTNLWCLSSPDFIFSKSTDSIQLNKNRMCISSLFQDYIKFPNIFYDCCRTINVNSSIRYRLVMMTKPDNLQGDIKKVVM
jgi:hypothetical protein